MLQCWLWHVVIFGCLCEMSTAPNLLIKSNAELNLGMDTLSMGMSDDLAAAIQAGSTMVRIGRAIFGERV